MDGLLYYQRLLYILDGPYRLQILQSCYDFHIVGHFGFNKTMELTIYRAISGGHRCGKPLRIILQTVTYIPVPRLLVIVRTGYYAHCQIQRNHGPQYLWISS
jgi:hypothetical protein